MTDTHLSDHNTGAPRSLTDLFVTFTLLALQGFGGVLAVAHRTLVEHRRWMTREEFVETLSLSQLLPGANIVNMALMIGDRHFGWRGALTALAGMLSVPLLIVLALVAVYNEFAHLPAVAGALRGMGAVAAGLTIGMGIKLAGALRGNPMGIPLCVAIGVATFVLVAIVRAPLVWVVPGLGFIGWCLARWAILRAERRT
ncbi:MAG: chromate transporter [Zoogloeaceae bacterium]|nr:chromate transporter [Zoogloeaceae bacterium]